MKCRFFARKFGPYFMHWTPNIILKDVIAILPNRAGLRMSCCYGLALERVGVLLNIFWSALKHIWHFCLARFFDSLTCFEKGCDRLTTDRSIDRTSSRNIIQGTLCKREWINKVNFDTWNVPFYFDCRNVNNKIFKSIQSRKNDLSAFRKLDYT